jgi:hypothetical protein
MTRAGINSSEQKRQFKARPAVNRCGHLALQQLSDFFLDARGAILSGRST